MAWKQSLEAFAFRRGSSHLRRLRMAAFSRHPELLATLKSARLSMQMKGKSGPYTIQDYLECSSDKGMALALVPFDFETQQIQIDKSHPFVLHFGGLPLALVAAAQKNSIGLVSLVLAHPNAQDLDHSHIRLALLNVCFEKLLPASKPHLDQRIRLALLSHPSAVNLRMREEQSTLALLEKTLQDPRSTLEDYAIVLMQLPDGGLHTLSQKA